MRALSKHPAEEMNPISIAEAIWHVDNVTWRVFSDWARQAYRKSHAFGHDRDGTVLLRVAGGWFFRIGKDPITDNARCYGAFRMED